MYMCSPLVTSCGSEWAEHTLETTPVNNLGCYATSSQTYTSPRRFEAERFTSKKEKLEIAFSNLKLSFSAMKRIDNAWISK
jgi:hypothetical protein